MFSVTYRYWVYTIGNEKVDRSENVWERDGWDTDNIPMLLFTFKGFRH